ncbi:MAG TPA: FAD-dependent oxidoreductase [Ktedonosporobacter sp.]|nr:FAD-dependent oxidoreductase [Ktedonosporobacter sp.]
MNSRALTPAQGQSGKPYLDRADIVIVGNGIAGLTAAIEARHLAPDKRIVIITDQMHPTINTPALKQFAIAKLAREQLLAYPAGTERTERIHVVTARVEEIHAGSKYVTLNGGRGFGYGSLLIATGSSPQGLPENLPGRNFDGVMTLHRLQDYLDLRRRIGEISEAVVVGGGVHAAETVMGLHHWGIRVHWLIRGSTFMRNMLDKEASEMVLNRIRRSGITIYTETEVAGIVGRVGVVAGVITNQQQMIPCQLVLSCTGTQPVSSLAKHCSIPIRYKRGIIVDDKLRSSVRDIYAAGDVAALKNPLTGEYEPRAQWYAAVSQGRIAGTMLADQSELARQPFGVQWHATHVGDLSMLTVGDPLSMSERIVTLTDTSQGGYRRVTLLDDHLVGYLSLGPAQPDSLAIKRIIDEGRPVSNIIKRLLKGNIDARKYLSEIGSRAAEGMLTSPQLPPLNLVPNPLSPVEWRPMNEPLAPVAGAGNISELQTGEWDRDLVAQKAGTVRLGSGSADFTPYEEEFSPFTGNLPNLQDTGATKAALPQQAFSHNEMEEEFSPFTGNLPANPDWLNDDMVGPFTSKLPSKVVESSPVPVPVRNMKSSGLWSYKQNESAPPPGRGDPTRPGERPPNTGLLKQSGLTGRGGTGPNNGMGRRAPDQESRETVIESVKPTRATGSLWSYQNKPKSGRGR